MGAPFLWFVAGVVGGVVAATFAILWWLPPEHVLRWERGANGEKATAEVLSRPLRAAAATIERRGQQIGAQ